MKEVKFIELSENDIQFAAEVYNYYIFNTTSSYHTNPISTKDFVDYYQLKKSFTMVYIIKLNGVKTGFCLLKPYNAKKQAYNHTYEITIYIKSDYCNLGLGKQAVSFLEEKAIQKNVSVILAGMSADNLGSIKLFEKSGYERCGHFKKVGKKFGKLLVIYYYQKTIDTNLIY